MNRDAMNQAMIDAVMAIDLYTSRVVLPIDEEHKLMQARQDLLDCVKG